MKIVYAKALLAIAFIGVLLVPFVASPVRAQPKLGGTLVWGVSSDPDLPGLLGAGSGTFLFQQVAHQIFNTLVTYDAKTFEWRPELAQSWEISPDGLRIKFNLVRDAIWHDGVAFTSADIKYSLEKVNPVFNGFAAQFIKQVSRIETPDDFTVIIQMKQPWPAMFSAVVGFGGVGWSIVPKHLYEGKDIATNEYNSKPIGTGAWKFKEWAKGDHITLVRNEKYFKKGLPYLEQLVFKIIPNAAARALAFEKGDVDFLWALGGLSYADGVRLEGDIKAGKLQGKRVWFYPAQSGSSDILIFNLQPDGPAFFKDIRVRRAIAYAVDLKKMSELVYFGRADVMVNPVSPAPLMRWYYDPTIRQPTYDPAMANKLLDEAGYKRGPEGVRFKFRITVDTVGYSQYANSAAVLRDFLKEVGIQLDIVALDTAAWHDAVFRRWDYDTFIFPMSTGPDPLLIIRYYTGKGIERVSWSNAAGYNNSKVNELLGASEVEPNSAKRSQLVKDALRILVDDQAAFWMVARPYVNGVNLEFSDELQQGAWENAGGAAIQRFEGVFWTKGTPLVTATTTAVTTPAAAPPAGIETTVAAIIIAIIVIGSATVFWLRRSKKKSAT